MSDETDVEWIYEVAYATLREQAIVPVRAPRQLTVAEAIEASGISARFPEIELQSAKVGIFGKVAKPDALLTQGDRVEIYRPLIADPKEARRKRAAQGKALRKGGGA